MTYCGRIAGIYFIAGVHLRPWFSIHTIRQSIKKRLELRSTKITNYPLARQHIFSLSANTEADFFARFPYAHSLFFLFFLPCPMSYKKILLLSTLSSIAPALGTHYHGVLLAPSFILFTLFAAAILYFYCCLYYNLLSTYCIIKV